MIETSGDPIALLANTPYLIEDGSDGLAEFVRVQRRSRENAKKARAVGEKIRVRAEDILETFGITLKSEIVAESNSMEHLYWTSADVERVVLNHRDLLSLPEHTFLKAITADDRTYEALGLYYAQQVVEDWAENDVRPREVEIRQLHQLITQNEAFSGRYKLGSNQISGAAHRPPAPADAAEAMKDLSKWWQDGSGDPLLDATVVHAWLAHIHPFDDGNGRVARLLANLALAQGNHPPLIISASTDRGEYYDALAASDDGNILPLFVLFERVMRRTVREMSKPDYVDGVIQSRLLSTPNDRQRHWSMLMESFTNELRQALASHGLEFVPQGYPSPTSFQNLARYSADGNSWYAKIDAESHAQWLLWFGYNSIDYREVFRGNKGYPSIFLSERDRRPGALHPYTPVTSDTFGNLYTEIVVVPAKPTPVMLRSRSGWDELPLPHAARRIASALASEPTQLAILTH